MYLGTSGGNIFLPKSGAFHDYFYDNEKKMRSFDSGYIKLHQVAPNKTKSTSKSRGLNPI